MGTTTTIAWTDKTYNPWLGCQVVTEAECGDCYAKRWAHRHGLSVWGPLFQSHRQITKTGRDPYKWNAQAEAEGKRFKVFCASLADVFEPHPDVVEARARLWETIEATPYLDWQLLTKRPKFIKRLVPESWLQSWPAHVWIGTSVGTQAAAEKRIPYLLEVPAHIRFLSCEPLVEQVTLAPWLDSGLIHWAICSGYSGSQDRPMELAWVRSLRDECFTSGTSFFMKQLGTVYAKAHRLRNWKGEDVAEFPADLQIQEFPEILNTEASANLTAFWTSTSTYLEATIAQNGPILEEYCWMHKPGGGSREQCARIAANLTPEELAFGVQLLTEAEAAMADEFDEGVYEDDPPEEDEDPAIVREREEPKLEDEVDEWRDLSEEEADSLERAATLGVLGVLHAEDTPPEIVAERERAFTLAEEMARELAEEPGPPYVLHPCENAATHGEDCYNVYSIKDPDDCVQAHVSYAAAYHFIYEVYPPSDNDFTDEVDA